MKLIAPLIVALALPAFAGSGKEVVPEPVAEPSLLQWFAGGSIGYLTEFEEPMYHLHVGQDTQYQIGGWDFAWFLEIGYTDKDESYTGSLSTIPPALPSSFSLDDLEDYLSTNAGPVGAWNYDMSIIPITLNGKFEREFAQNWKVYAGAGAGFALVDLDVNAGTTSLSDDDWVFTAQVFAGVQYDINPKWELYGGARWIYFDDADIGAYTLKMDDDFLFEIGTRYNF
jgi:opacity protein-like surface antigen